MIVQMKEVTIATTRSDEAATLAELQDAGVVHLAASPPVAADPTATMRGRLDAARHAADVLSRVKVQPLDRSAVASLPGSVEEVVDEVARLMERLEDLRRTRTDLERERARMAPFGSFDPLAVRRLREQGVSVRLFNMSARTELPAVEGATWVELASDRRRRPLALVGASGVVDVANLPDEVALPDAPPARLDHDLQETDRAVERAQLRLAALAEARDAVERLARRTEDELRFEEARASMATVGAVSVLRGYVPSEEVERLRKLAAAHGWAIWTGEVTDLAEAPTLIRNASWVRPIAPLFAFLGVAPAYGQVDISIPFLVFFSLFFAMIVGDAGYGLLFLVFTMLGRRMYPGLSGRLFALLILLSASTIAWGLASGSFFGVGTLPPMLRVLRLDWLGEERNLMALAFTVGVVHLTLAHVWNMVRFINNTRALAELGWVATTWTMYFLARALVLGDAFPSFGWPLFGTGVLLIILFSTPVRLLRDQWFKHAMMPLNLVGNFVDVVSYVRLFAVGAATFAVASAFNDLAMNIGFGGVLGGLLTALVLFFGHTLNILLAAMGVLVHGVRLNTLEFAAHVDLSWTGQPYRPFARSVPLGSEGELTWTPS